MIKKFLAVFNINLNIFNNRTFLKEEIYRAVFYESKIEN